MVKEFNNLREIQKYYDKRTDTYVFKEYNEYIDLIKFNFNLIINSNINACDISACNIIAGNIVACDINANNINALDINANDIIARNISAHNINYYAVCCAYCSIECNLIKGECKNAKHFALNGKLEVKK